MGLFVNKNSFNLTNTSKKFDKINIFENKNLLNNNNYDNLLLKCNNLINKMIDYKIIETDKLNVILICILLNLNVK